MPRTKQEPDEELRLETLSDEELAQVLTRQAANEQVRRERLRALASRGVARVRSPRQVLEALNGRAAVARAATAWEDMAADADAELSEGFDVDHARLARSTAPFIGQAEGEVQKAQAALARDRVTVPRNATQPGTVRDAWEHTAAIGRAEAARAEIGPPDPALLHFDPDDLEEENVALGTPDAVSVARYRP